MSLRKRIRYYKYKTAEDHYSIWKIDDNNSFSFCDHKCKFFGKCIHMLFYPDNNTYRTTVTLYTVCNILNKSIKIKNLYPVYISDKCLKRKI